jgi:[ribosomal protein S5]-alanine N-acetyltransferase
MKSSIFLRELLESDVNSNYLEGFSDEIVTSFLEVDGKNLTKEDVIEYMNYGRATKSYFMYAVCLKHNNQQIGNLKIGPIDYNNMLSDLVTVIWDKNYWGKGLATEAIKLGNKLAFEEYNIRKLTGGIYSENIGSIKAYPKAGWIIEGKLQNHYIVGGKLEDRILVSCFNPAFFSSDD